MLRPPVAALALVVLVACGGSGGSPPAADPDARLVDAHAALCDAAADPAHSRTLFFDRSHDALHEVARDLEGKDRALAGRLLEAKEVVEAEVDGPGPARPDDLRRLADVYRTALARLAIAAPPCDK